MRRFGMLALGFAATAAAFAEDPPPKSPPKDADSPPADLLPSKTPPSKTPPSPKTVPSPARTATPKDGEPAKAEKQDAAAPARTNAAPAPSVGAGGGT